MSDGFSPISPEVAHRVIDLFRSFKPPEQADYNLDYAHNRRSER